MSSQENKVEQENKYICVFWGVGIDPIDPAEGVDLTDTSLNSERILYRREDKKERDEEKDEEIDEERIIYRQEDKKEIDEESIPHNETKIRDGDFIVNTDHEDKRDRPSYISFVIPGERLEDAIEALMLSVQTPRKSISDDLIYATGNHLYKVYGYKTAVCLLSLYVDTEIVFGGKVNRYNGSEFDCTDVCINIFDLKKEMSERDRKLINTVLKKRTMMSEYYEKFYVASSVNNECVLDYKNSYESEETNTIFNISMQEDVHKLKIQNYIKSKGYEFDLTSESKVKSDKSFLIFISTGPEHFAECFDALTIALSNLGY